jgi:hypothetical protein
VDCAVDNTPWRYISWIVLQAIHLPEFFALWTSHRAYEMLTGSTRSALAQDTMKLTCGKSCKEVLRI